MFHIASERGSRLHRVGLRGGDLGEGVPLRGASAAGEAIFSPGGRMLATTCMPEDTCLWDASRPVPALIRRLPGVQVLQWYDDDHILAARTKDQHHRETVLADLFGHHPRVIVRDESWPPGPGGLGVFSPIPPQTPSHPA